MQQLLTPEQASKLLAISVKQLRDLTDAGELAFVNIGLGTKRPTRRYLPEDLELFISRRRMERSPVIRNPTRKPPTPTHYPLLSISEIIAERKALKAAERETRRKQGK